MTPREIEDEIQARIEFKMEEFMTSLKNRLNIKHHQANEERTADSFYKWRAFKEICEVLRKEVRMGPPSDEMAKNRKWQAKEKAVDNIVKRLKLEGTDNWWLKQKIIANEIEDSQNW